MSEISDFNRAVVDVRNDLNATMQEAFATHGPGATLSALAMAAAAALHQSEHLCPDVQNSRAAVLGQWLSHFHRYLTTLNEQCDEGASFANRPPEGRA